MNDRNSSAANADTINCILAKTIEAIILKLQLPPNSAEALHQALQHLKDIRTVYGHSPE